MNFGHHCTFRFSGYISCSSDLETPKSEYKLGALASAVVIGPQGLSLLDYYEELLCVGSIITHL